MILLDSDFHEFGGHNRLEPATKKLFFPIIRERWQNRENHFHLYIPSRTSIVLCAEENLVKHKININGRGYQGKVEELSKEVKELKIE